MNTSVSGNIAEMYNGYLEQYFQRFGYYKKSLSFKTFHNRITANKIIKSGNWEYMNNAAFAAWLANPKVKSPIDINTDTGMYAACL